MKLIVFTCGNKEKLVAFNKNNFFEAIYDAETTIIGKEEYEALKKLGIDLDEFYKKGKSLEDFLENLKDEELKEEIEDIINDLRWLPQVYPSCYCENVISKKDIEDLKDVKYFLDNDGYLATKEDILGWDYDLCYAYWDGRNWRCCDVGEYYEIEVEEIEVAEEIDDPDFLKKYHYNYYKTKDNKIFRVHVSYYQGVLPTIDEKWGEWKEIYENL